MNRRLSRRSLLESGSLAIGVLIASGAISRTVADEEISEADKIKQMDAHYQRYPKGPQRCQICLQFARPTSARSCRGQFFRRAGASFSRQERMLGDLRPRAGVASGASP